MCKRFKDFDEESKQYNQILLDYLENGEKFVDPNFHPNKNIHENNIIFDESNTEWKRIDEVYSAPLFKKELIQIDFVKQGDIEDCFFLSALSYISSQPEKVPDFFDHRVELYLGKEEDSINLKCGAVVIYFYAFGRRVPVLIDTLIPFSKSTQTPLFSRPINHTKSAWFCLIEKAFAKLNGSYTEIIGGTFSQAIYSLYGYYTTTKSLSSLKSEVKSSKMSPYDRILKYLNKGAIVGAAIRIEMLDGLSEDDINSKGLAKDHFYIILSAKKVAGNNLLCLRNLWGEHEWNGDWSDESDLWSPELREAVGMKIEDDGTFWICDSDFLTYFTEIDVSKPIPNNWHSRQFFWQLMPGPHDGQDIESEGANLSERPNFAFKVIEPIAAGQTCRFHVLVERRPAPLDESRIESAEESKKPYCVFLASASGKKLEASELPYYRRYQMSTYSNIISFPYTVSSNDEIQTIVLYRLAKSDLIEDCYVRIICELDFNLYNIDEPENLIPEDSKTSPASDANEKEADFDEVMLNDEGIFLEEEEEDVELLNENENEENELKMAAFDDDERERGNGTDAANGFNRKTSDFNFDNEQKLNVNGQFDGQILNEEDQLDNEIYEFPSLNIKSMNEEGNSRFRGEELDANEKEIHSNSKFTTFNQEYLNSKEKSNMPAAVGRNMSIVLDHSIYDQIGAENQGPPKEDNMPNPKPQNQEQIIHLVPQKHEEGNMPNSKPQNQESFNHFVSHKHEEGNMPNPKPQNQESFNHFVSHKHEEDNMPNSKPQSQEPFNHFVSQKHEGGNMPNPKPQGDLYTSHRRHPVKEHLTQEAPANADEENEGQGEQSPHSNSDRVTKHKPNSPRRRPREVSYEQPPSKDLQQRKNAYKRMNETLISEKKRKLSPPRQQQQQNMNPAKSQKSDATLESTGKLRYKKATPTRNAEKANLSPVETSPTKTGHKRPKQPASPRQTYKDKDMRSMFNSISDNIFSSRYNDNK